MTWFDITARANFEKHLPDSDRSLQLGVWTGDASVWLMENTFTTLIDVDNFQGSDEHNSFDMERVMSEYKANMAPYQHRSQCIVDDTTVVLGQLFDAGQEFDFIYIDADHHAAAVLEDAVRAWPLLAPGGLLCFDDLTWKAPSRNAFDAPGLGITCFVQVYANQLEVVERNSQMWVRKL